MKRALRLIRVICAMLCMSQSATAQTTGTVYRDYNGNGTRQTSAPNEPLVNGIIVNAYNSNDALVASYTTTTAGTFSIPLTGSTYNGTQGSNTGSVANGLAVRLEFIIPASGACGLSPNIDYSTGNGSTVGSSVRFVTGGTTGITYAINRPADFISSTNPMVYMSKHTNGNPLGGGNSGTSTWFIGFPYNSSGTTAPTLTLNGTTIGCTWGVAYSKQAGKVFTSAFVKRHAGLGVLGSGGIYMLTPTATSFTVNNFYDLDAAANLGAYRTRANAAATPPAYGVGTSFSLNGANTIATYLGSIDAASGQPIGMGVIGTNVNRGLPNTNNTENWDPAAFDQVGKVGLGDLEISDDGKYLFVINLYDRKVYRLELNNAYTPTSVITVTSYALPAVAVTNGVLRPFGAKFYRGKLYVGAVSTAENAGTVADLNAYVFELNNATGTASFTATPVVNYPLNYTKGGSMTWTGPYGTQWYPWSNNTSVSVGSGDNRTYPTPVLSNIEFDERGDMVMSFFDRGGNQWSEDNYRNLAISTTLTRYAVGGDILIAGSNCNGTFTLENNGAYTSANGTSYNSGAANNEGPLTSEFFKGDSYATTHAETSLGALGYLAGSGEVYFGTMDPLAINSGGTKRLSMSTGLEVAGSPYELSGASIAGFGKAISLGDIEFFGTEPPIELGNRIWNDANGDGIQNPGESGIAGVTLELVDATGNPVDSDLGTAGVQATFVTTDATGNWYITSATGTDATGINYRVALLPNTQYRLKLATGVGDDWDPAANGGQGGPRAGQQLVGFGLTKTDKIGNGAVDLSDNDASMISSTPEVTITTGGYGQNNHDIDIGFKQLASIGDRVWRDDNKDGLQTAGEPGVAGITVTLYQNGTDGIAGTADDVVIGTTVTDAYGNYLFDNLTPTNQSTAATINQTSYSVGFTLPANYIFTTTVTPGDNGNNTNSDPSATTGRTVGYNLTTGERDLTVDAGIIFNTPAVTASVGDRVWFDTNGNGTQDAGEPGVSGVTVTLYNSAGAVVGTTITDANGYYLFTNVTPGSGYTVGFTPPAGTAFTTSAGAVSVGTNSDANTTTGRTAAFNVAAGEQVTYVDAGLVLQSTALASLGDRVWYDNNRDGDQDAGEPGIAGVTVNLYLDADGNGVLLGAELTTPVRTTTTDAFGNYIFNGLTPGSYGVVFVTPSGLTITTRDATGGTVPFDGTDSDADQVTGRTILYGLPAGAKNLSVDCGMYSTAPAANVGALGNFVWNDLDGDGVQDAGEPGVAGITVILYNNAGTPVDTVTTDATGAYLFTNLAPGNYTVGFSNLPAGFGFTGQDRGGNDATDSDVNPATGRTASATVTGGATNTTVDAGIRQGVPSGLGSLGNRVWYDLNNNGLQDAGELGVAGVTVTLLDAGADGIVGNGDDGASRTTRTNALGEYLFGGLPAGNYAVQFGTAAQSLPAGFTAATQNAGTNDNIDSDGGAIATGGAPAGSSRTAVYNLAQGEDNLSVDLGIVPPVNTNTVSGQAWFDNAAGGGTAADGIRNGTEVNGGVAGVTVTLYNGSGVAIGTTTTDANGNFSFVGVPNGTGYTVGFSNYPPGMNPSPRTADGATNSDADRTSGRTGSFNLTGGTNIINMDAGIFSTRAALGNFVWSDLDNDGAQDAGEPGVAGVTVSLYFDADNNGSITGAEATNPVATAITDGSGAYFFPNLVPGNYQVGFTTVPNNMLFTRQNTPGDNGDNTNSDAAPATGLTGIIALAAGEIDNTIDAGLTVAQPATIGNRVWADLDRNGLQDAGEPGISGILVTLFNSSNVAIGSAITDGNGNWQITNVPPGTGYYLAFTPNLPNFNTTATPGSNPAWTQQNIGANGTAGLSSGTESDVDSDVNPTGANPGRTGTFNIAAGNNFPNMDAGIINWPFSSLLPIKLESFTAAPQGGNVLLKWTVSEEINVDRYEIEFSTNGRDFASIGSTPGVSSRNYQLLHTSPITGINYYRLKTIDKDGAISYSEVRKVNFGKGSALSVYPNPVKDNLNITVTGDMVNKPATISILAMDGKLMLQQRINAMNQTENINTHALGSGKYIVRIVTDSEVINKAIEVIR